jgi:hypothetical protein
VVAQPKCENAALKPELSNLKGLLPGILSSLPNTQNASTERSVPSKVVVMLYKDNITGSQPAPLKISNPNNLCHANVSEQYAMSASKVVAFSADTVAGYTAETVTSVKPARDDFTTVTRKKQGDNPAANSGTNPTQTRKPRSHMTDFHNSSSLSVIHTRVKTKSLFLCHFSPDYLHGY